MDGLLGLPAGPGLPPGASEAFDTPLRGLVACPSPIGWPLGERPANWGSYLQLVSRYCVHAAVLVIALVVSGYASMQSQSTSGTQLRLGVVNAAGQAYGQGGQVGDVTLGRLSTIIKPLELPTGPAVSHVPGTYTVGAGETLQAIADKLGVTPDDLRWSNAALTSTDNVKEGQQLTVPPIHGIVYTAAAGDTVPALADRFKVDPQTIADFNSAGTGALPAGIQVIIPGGTGPQLFPRRVSNDPPHLGTYANGKFAYGYCTWYVASRRPVPWTGDAWAWFGNAQAMGFPTGSTPQPGAVMVTWESYVGHVAYVESVNADGTFTVSEMNYKGWGLISTRTLTTRQVPLIGFIYG